MPRRRKRKTNRRTQGERMLRVRGIRRGTPDAKKLSRAFIGLALARAEAEAQAEADAQAEARCEEQPAKHESHDREIRDGGF